MKSEKMSRQELAEEFSKISEHSSAQIDKVLSAFFDPNNPEIGLEKFIENLAKLATSGIDLNENDMAILNALNSVVGDVKDARLFNDTYIGHMLSEASIPGMLGYLIGIRTGSNTVAREVSIFESQIEPEAIKGIADIIGYDPEYADGTFTSGGSMAMQVALMSARRMMEKEGKRATKKHPFLVFGTRYTHYSVSKMVDIVGGPSHEIIKKDMNCESFVMDPQQLDFELRQAKKNRDQVMAVVAIGGETETGLVDPIADIIDVADHHGVRVIVDGAYGAPYRISRKGDLLLGMERAFAVTIDPHKALYTPYSNGAVLFREGKKDMYLGYVDRDGYLGVGENLGQKRIEGSMGAGPILSTVAVMRALGKEGLSTLYDLTLDRIDYLYNRIENSEVLVPMHKPDLNLLCFTLSANACDRLKIGDADNLKKVMDEIKNELDKKIQGLGGYFFSTSPLPMPDGSTWPVFRACVMNPRTTDRTLNNAIAELEKMIAERYKR